MQDGASFFELRSYVKSSQLDVLNSKLIEAMRFTAIKGFGWSVGLVMDVDPYRPKARDKAIEAVIQTDESFDNWSLSSKGELYILKTLFEDRRDRTAIFIDTRLVRLFEALARVAALYKYLGVDGNSAVVVQFNYGGLLNRILKVANQNRLMAPIPRVSSTDTFSRTIEFTLSELFSIENIERVVVRNGIELAQLFDSFELKEDIAQSMIREHNVFKGVQDVFRRLNSTAV